MNRYPGLIAAVMLLLAFGVGGLTGMVIEEALGLDWFDFLDEDSQQDDGALLSGLEISPAQRDRIDVILDSQQGRLEEYWERRIPEMRAVVADSYDQIRAVLTPEQRATFDRRIEARGIPLPWEPD